jgi:hypothetical protein
MMDGEKQSCALVGGLSSALRQRDGGAVGIDDKGIDLTELFQRLQQCRGDRPVEIVFANSSRAVGSWMLDAVPDVQRDARREVRTGAGRDKKAIQKAVNKRSAFHLR